MLLFLLDFEFDSDIIFVAIVLRQLAGKQSGTHEYIGLDGSKKENNTLFESSINDRPLK